MKRLFIIFFTIFVFSFLNFSCKTISAAGNASRNKKANYGYAQKVPEISVDKYLPGRVWILSGCKFKDDFRMLSADLKISRILFRDNGKFEATSGINSYYGTWKIRRKLNKFEYKFSLKVKQTRNIDSTNTIGIPFDKAFQNALYKIDLIEVDQYSIRFYSKDRDLLLHFVRS